MPLTPNGKVDKNALPYPDTAQVAAAEAPVALTVLERRLVDIWSKTMFPPPEGAPADAKPRRIVGVDENFFDIGGHSILATRLIFQIRQQLKLEGDRLPLNVLFRCPTIKSMASEIEQTVGFGLVDEKRALSKMDFNHAADALTQKQAVEECPDLSAELVLPDVILAAAGMPSILEQPQYLNEQGLFVPKQVFLTGVTGFLGAFLLHFVLKEWPQATVHCLVRAKSVEDGMKRLADNMEGHLLWKSAGENDANTQAFKERVKIVCGDLAKPWLGVGVSSDKEIPAAFQALADTVDCVIHNGAFVHWVYPYQTLKPANVDGTMEALKLCVMGKDGHAKPFHFVSSTSVLDSAVYNDRITAVMESDDLEGSRGGLNSGYGQSKWVAEKLLMMARRGGEISGPGSSKTSVKLPISIIRPGYIVGDSDTGVTNADDFLWRLAKGCIQLGQVPVMSNVVNMCPVDFVARACVRVVQRGQDAVQRGVFHIWNPSRVRFMDFFRELQAFGYDALPQGLQFGPYLSWRDDLMRLTLEGKDNALYPLLHFVLDDLPTSTKSPNLDWRNLRWALQGSEVVCAPITEKREDSLQSESEMSDTEVISQRKTRSQQKAVMERYLTYLCSVGFLPWPPGRQTSSGTTKVPVKAHILSRSGRTVQ